MSKEKSPAFQFYPKEFISDGNVLGMSLQQRGAYITLLCVCWQDGSIPGDRQALANIVGVPLRAFIKFWPPVQACFREREGRFIHPRLEQERGKQASYRRRQSDAGKASAAARSQREGNHEATAVEPKH